MDLYIYYRVRSEHASALNAQVRALHRCIAREYAIVTGLKRRPEERDGRQTWMEIYQAVPDDFAETLERRVAQNGITELIDGRRNIEYFLDLPPCA